MPVEAHVAAPASTNSQRLTAKPAREGLSILCACTGPCRDRPWCRARPEPRTTAYEKKVDWFGWLVGWLVGFLESDKKHHPGGLVSGPL